MILFCVTVVGFLFATIEVNRYSYALRSLRSFMIAWMMVVGMGVLMNTNGVGIIVYLTGAVIGTLISTFFNRQSAIMGGE